MLTIEIQIMNAVELKSATSRVVRYYGRTMLTIPKTILNTWLKVVCFPLILGTAALKLVTQGILPTALRHASQGMFYSASKLALPRNLAVVMNGVYQQIVPAIATVKASSQNSSKNSSSFPSGVENSPERMKSNSFRDDESSSEPKKPNTLGKNRSPMPMKSDPMKPEISAGAVRCSEPKKPNTLGKNRSPMPMKSDQMKPETSAVAERCSEPRSEDIVRNAKKLRNNVAMSITHFTGDDLFWDLPLLREKTKRYSEACIEGDRVKMAAAKKAIDDHPVHYPKPKSKEEYDRLMEEARTGYFPVAGPVTNENVKSPGKICNGKLASIEYENETEDSKVSNILKKPSKKVELCSNIVQPKKRELEGTSTKCRHDQQLSLQNKVLKNRLRTANNNLEGMLESFYSLLGEVSTVNDRLGKLQTVSSKISNLQDELDEGRKMLREVEAERNEMRHKLVTLEGLIKEEEEYLDDLSCESGYEEVENTCESPDY